MRTLVCRSCMIPITKPIVELQDKSRINFEDKDGKYCPSRLLCYL